MLMRAFFFPNALYKQPLKIIQKHCLIKTKLEKFKLLRHELGTNCARAHNQIIVALPRIHLLSYKTNERKSVHIGVRIISHCQLSHQTDIR